MIAINLRAGPLDSGLDLIDHTGVLYTEGRAPASWFGKKFMDYDRSVAYGGAFYSKRFTFWLYLTRARN